MWMLFEHIEYYPSGGLGDLIGTYRTLEELKVEVKNRGWYGLYAVEAYIEDGLLKFNHHDELVLSPLED
jgi:hypothetical protein